MTINIGYLVHEFGTGGIERCVVNLVNNLDTERFSPAVFCVTKSGTSATLVRSNVAVVEIGKRPGADWASVGRLAKAFASQKIDVLHSHNWGTLIEGSLARRKARVPVHVHTEHGQGLHADLSFAKRWVRRIVSRTAFAKLSQLCVCARSVSPLVEKRSGFAADRMMYQPNGVPHPGIHNSAFRTEQRSRLNIPEQSFVLGSIGRMAEVKGFELAIDTIASVRQAGNEASLILVGDGPKKNDWMAHASQRGVEQHVHFVGEQKNIGDWLSCFDAFVNTSHSEAMSLSVLEAMAMGLPTIAADVGDNREVLFANGECGVVYSGRDPEVVGKAVQSLILDVHRRQTFAATAERVFREHYSIDSMTKRHMNLYARLMNAK